LNVVTWSYLSVRKRSCSIGDAIAAKLASRPRKRLGYGTPEE